MAIRRVTLILASCLLCACSSNGGSDSPSSDDFGVELHRVFPNLSFTRPVAMLQAPGDSTHFYVVEKDGSVRAFENDPAADDTSIFFCGQQPAGFQPR